MVYITNAIQAESDLFSNQIKLREPYTGQYPRPVGSYFIENMFSGFTSDFLRLLHIPVSEQSFLMDSKLL